MPDRGCLQTCYWTVKDNPSVRRMSCTPTRSPHSGIVRFPAHPPRLPLHLNTAVQRGRERCGATGKVDIVFDEVFASGLRARRIGRRLFIVPIRPFRDGQRRVKGVFCSRRAEKKETSRWLAGSSLKLQQLERQDFTYLNIPVQEPPQTCV